MADEDKRSIIAKAKDEYNQLKTGVKSVVDGNALRTRYGSSSLSSEIRDFKTGYNKKENEQKTARQNNMKSMGGKVKKNIKDNRYGQGGVMQHD